MTRVVYIPNKQPRLKLRNAARDKVEQTFFLAMSRRAAAGIRSKLLAKRPHCGGRGPGKKLDNVGEIWGRFGEDLRYLGNLAKT